MAIKVSFIQGRPRPRDAKTGRFASWTSAWKSRTFRQNFKDAFTSRFKPLSDAEARAKAKAEAKEKKKEGERKKLEETRERITKQQLKKRIFRPKSPYYKPKDVLEKIIDSFDIDVLMFAVSPPIDRKAKVKETEESKKKSTTRLAYIRDFKHTDPETKWCFNGRKPNYQYKPKRIIVWYLYYIPESDSYNIFPMTIPNPERLTLKSMLKAVKETFIESANRHFTFKAENEGTQPIEVIDVPFITPYEVHRRGQP